MNKFNGGGTIHYVTERRKNHEIILEAMHRCKSDLPLVIIGRSSEYKQTLLSLIEKYGLQNRVILLHDVPTADLPAIYRAASLFVYPSHFEGFGILSTNPTLPELRIFTTIIPTKKLFEDGFGTEVNPYKITNWTQLQNINNSNILTKNYYFN